MVLDGDDRPSASFLWPGDPLQPCVAPSLERMIGHGSRLVPTASRIRSSGSRQPSGESTIEIQTDEIAERIYRVSVFVPNARLERRLRSAVEGPNGRLSRKCQLNCV